jgi:hypothetical protein
MEGLGHAMDPHLCRPSEELAYAMQIVRERLRGIVRLERSFVSPLLRDDVVPRVANGLGERVRETPRFAANAVLRCAKEFDDLGTTAHHGVDVAHGDDRALSRHCR